MNIKKNDNVKIISHEVNEDGKYFGIGAEGRVVDIINEDVLLVSFHGGTYKSSYGGDMWYVHPSSVSVM